VISDDPSIHAQMKIIRKDKHLKQNNLTYNYHMRREGVNISKKGLKLGETEIRYVKQYVL
jgi:hypothetical protein